MTTFYEIHRDAIERAFREYAPRVGEPIQVIVQEPIVPRISESGSIVAGDETATIVTFRLLPKGVYAPASPAVVEIIRDFNKRHKDTPASAWELPDFSE